MHGSEISPAEAGRDLQTWRVGAIQKLLWLGVFQGTFVIIGALMAWHPYSLADRYYGIGAVCIGVLGAWLFGMRPYLEERPKGLWVQNPVRSFFLPYSEIKSVGYVTTGLVFTLKDGRELVAWAVQQGLGLTVLGRPTRVTRIADRVRSRIDAVEPVG